MLTHEIRTRFLTCFKQQGHFTAPSAPLIPYNDPTLLFVNAGMVPFKNVFTILEKRPYNRAASSQKCLRAGGKHNDLENVGYTTRHHTFFEMLGNFSFGDYFKEEAIFFAWNFITKELVLSSHRLCVTVFSEDKEAAALWRKVAGLSIEKIIPIPTADNFWSMGDLGPCGPCTEIFYDHGPHIPWGPPGSAEADGDRFVEIWNLVFMQFEQQTKGLRVPLPKPSIDTGMGLDRIAAVMQGVSDNYDTDILIALVEQAAHLLSIEPHLENRPSLKVLADHVRAGGFLIADGVLPSNEGRGYVLRRILRRAMRHGYLLGAREPLLVKLIPTLITKMGDAYPELGRAHSLMTTTFDLEERRFQQTLEHGLSLLARETALLRHGESLPGAVAFKLYDTFGFPLDLTQDILKEQGRSVDRIGFEAVMAQQRAAARAAWSGSGEKTMDGLYFDLAKQLGVTGFLGYEQEQAQGQIQVLLVNGQLVPELHAGEEGILIVNQTPFYGESGGQMGDAGLIEGVSGIRGVIEDTQKKGGLILHTVRLETGTLIVGQEVTLRIDSARRQSLRTHHSVTHLLHQALREVLGTHVTQRGSLVAPEKLRFDFSHPARLSAEEFQRVERLVNEKIRANLPVSTRLMTPEAATQAGVLALFGEKYGDEVRVVKMGHDMAQEPFSIELCGGTHVVRTGDIGFFKITGESGVAAGIRRLEAVAGTAAEDYVEDCQRLTEKVRGLLGEKRALQQELQTLRQTQPQAKGSLEPLSGGASFLFQETTGLRVQDMKRLIDQLKRDVGTGVVALGQTDAEKTTLLIGMVGGRYDAGLLLKRLLQPHGGQGGGRPDLAQGGWTGLPELKDMIYFLKKQLQGVSEG